MDNGDPIVNMVTLKPQMFPCYYDVEKLQASGYVGYLQVDPRGLLLREVAPGRTDLPPDLTTQACFHQGLGRRLSVRAGL